MIRPATVAGAVFGTAADGDPRAAPDVRSQWAARLGISDDWVWLRQVHGVEVHQADRPGPLGDGDAVFTTVPDLPLAVATADCFPVVLVAEGAVGIAHAGWRGVAAGVVPSLVAAMSDAGVAPHRAVVGPGIGPCCFEVGPEVAEEFPSDGATTTWGTTSVDLASALRRQLEGLQTEWLDDCTMSSEGFNSYRRDATTARQVAVTWVTP